MKKSWLEMSDAFMKFEASLGSPDDWDWEAIHSFECWRKAAMWGREYTPDEVPLVEAHEQHLAMEYDRVIAEMEKGES